MIHRPVKPSPRAWRVDPFSRLPIGPTDP